MKEEKYNEVQEALSMMMDGASASDVVESFLFESVDLVRPNEVIVGKEYKSRLWREIDVSAPHRLLSHLATPKVVVRAQREVKATDRGWGIYLANIDASGRSSEKQIYDMDNTKKEALDTAKTVLARKTNELIAAFNKRNK